MNIDENEAKLQSATKTPAFIPDVADDADMEVDQPTAEIDNNDDNWVDLLQHTNIEEEQEDKENKDSNKMMDDFVKRITDATHKLKKDIGYQEELKLEA